MPTARRKPVRRATASTRDAAELQRISDQLARAWQGEAWHGPAVREVLRGIDAGLAAARPAPGAHSIWELVLHIATWKTVVRRRMAGEVFSVTPEQDWPPVPAGATPAAWRKTLAALEDSHRALAAAIRTFPAARLEQVVGGKNYSFYVMLHGVVQHDLYHAGQIALLKRATS